MTIFFQLIKNGSELKLMASKGSRDIRSVIDVTYTDHVRDYVESRRHLK